MNRKKVLLITLLILFAADLIFFKKIAYFYDFHLPQIEIKDKPYIIYKTDEKEEVLSDNKDCGKIDLNYKKEIIKKSNNKNLTLKKLDNVMGPCEIEKYMESKDASPEIYTPSPKNIKNGIYNSTFHMHSLQSDGIMSIEELFDSAQKYSLENLKNDEFFYIATTDHNTTNGAKEAIEVLIKNSEKYDKIKIVLGMEVNSTFDKNKPDKNSIQIHVLALGINPYDEFLNNEFYKKDPNDKWNIKRADENFDDFDNVIKVMNKHAIVGIAHPARYVAHLGDKKYDHIKNLFERYTSLTPKNKPKFTEAYYQSYANWTKSELKGEYKEFLSYIIDEAKKFKIIRTGDIDSHGKSIFRYRD